MEPRAGQSIGDTRRTGGCEQHSEGFSWWHFPDRRTSTRLRRRGRRHHTCVYRHCGFAFGRRRQRRYVSHVNTRGVRRASIAGIMGYHYTQSVCPDESRPSKSFHFDVAGRSSATTCNGSRSLSVLEEYRKDALHQDPRSGFSLVAVGSYNPSTEIGGRERGGRQGYRCGLASQHSPLQVPRRSSGCYSGSTSTRYQ